MEHSRDDGFSDLHLTRKQTVFLLVASTVVMSVAFIAGVLVGRGVKGTLAPALYSESAVTETPLPDELPPPPPVQSGNAQSAEGIVKEAVSYPDRLTQSAPTTEQLSDTPMVRNEVLPGDAAAAPVSNGPRVAPAAEASLASGTSASGEAPPRTSDGATPPPPASRAPAFAEPAGPGVVVQVSAFRNRREADAMAGRLASKGYGVYVMAPAPGAPNLFRVRVGKFATRADADRVMTRLKREEKLDPWIVP